MPEDLGNINLAKSEGLLTSIHFFEKDKAGNSYLGATDIIVFSETCHAARSLTADVRKSML